MIKRILLASAIFCLIAASPSQLYALDVLHWKPIGWAGGGIFPALVPDPTVNGRAYLLSDVAGIWRTENRGDTWQYKTEGLKNLIVSCLAMAPSNTNILYAGTAAGMHRSIDAGETWEYLSATKNTIVFTRPDNYRSILVDPADPNKVYAGTMAGGVFFTSDGGATWTRLGGTGAPFASAIPVTALYLSRDRSHLFASSAAGLSRYDLASGLWSSVDVAGNKIYDMLGFTDIDMIYISYGKKIAWSANLGASWQYSSDAFALTSSALVYRIAVKYDHAGNTKLLAGWTSSSGGGVMLSEDNGATWLNISKNLVYDTAADPTRAWMKGFQRALCVSFDPFNLGVFYYTDWWGVWRSDDNGASWNEKIKGAYNTVGSDIAFRANGDLLVATMDNGLVGSSDMGQTYHAICPAPGTDPSLSGQYWRILTPGNRILAATSPWNGTANQIVLSEDGGSTFRSTRSGLPSTYPVINTLWGKGYARALAQDPKDPNKIYLGIDGDDGGGFFSSSDGGQNWARSSGQPGSLKIYNGLVVDPLEPNRIYWGALGGVYRSEDYGKSWIKVLANNVFDLAISKEGHVYAACALGGPQLYASYDKGLTWVLLQKFPAGEACEAIAIDPSNSMRIAVSAVQWSGNAPGKIYASEDQGITWTDVTADLPAGAGAAAMVFKGGFLYMSRAAGSVYRLNLDQNAPDILPPSLPQNLSGSLAGPAVLLKWNASSDDTGIVGYKIYRNGTLIATVSTTSYADSGVIAGSTYSYSVVAYDATGNLSSGGSTAIVQVPDNAQ